MTIGERIAFFRKTYKIKQGVFAESIDISQSHISKIENNQDMPSDRLIQKIIATWGINKEWLLNENGEITTEKSITPTTKNQCISAINDQMQKYGEKSANELSALIVKFLHITDAINYFVSDKTLDGLIDIEPMLTDIQKILDYWVEEHKKKSSINYSAEDGEKSYKELTEISEIYYNQVIHSFENIFSRITANMKCLSEYWERETIDYLNSTEN